MVKTGGGGSCVREESQGTQIKSTPIRVRTLKGHRWRVRILNLVKQEFSSSNGRNVDDVVAHRKRQYLRGETDAGHEGEVTER